MIGYQDKEIQTYRYYIPASHTEYRHPLLFQPQLRSYRLPLEIPASHNYPYQEYSICRPKKQIAVLLQMQLFGNHLSV